MGLRRTDEFRVDADFKFSAGYAAITWLPNRCTLSILAATPNKGRANSSSIRLSREGIDTSKAFALEAKDDRPIF